MSPQRLSAPVSQKVQNGVENESKSTIFQLFWLVFGSVWDFLDTWGERPWGLIFWLFFSTWARRAQMTLVAGSKKGPSTFGTILAQLSWARIKIAVLPRLLVSTASRKSAWEKIGFEKVKLERNADKFWAWILGVNFWGGGLGRKNLREKFAIKIRGKIRRQFSWNSLGQNNTFCFSFAFHSPFAMEKKMKSPRFSFAFSFVMIMLGTHKP